MNELNVLFIDPQQLRYDYGLLENLNCNVTFCCRDKYDDPGIESIVLKKYFRYHLYDSIILKSLSYAISLIRTLLYIIIHRPDVIHIQWWRIWYLDYLFLFCARPFTKSIIFTAHNLLPHDTGISMKTKCVKYYNKVDYIIVHAYSTKDELINDFGINASKIYVIKHGLMKVKCNEEEVRGISCQIKEKYKIDSKIVFTLLGNQNQYKGFDLVEEVWTTTPELKNNEDVILFVAGKSRTVNTKRLELSSNVVIIDRILTDEEFMAITDVSSIVLLPYTKISQSGLLLTALEQEKPVLVSNVGGLTEPLDYADIGWNIGLPSVSNLRSKMLEIIRNPQQIDAINENVTGWGKIKSIYSWSEIAKQTMMLYWKSIQNLKN